MQIMKRICTILWLFFFCELAFADLAIHYEIKGVPENIEKNIQARLLSEQMLYPQPFTEDVAETFYKEAPKTILAAVEPYGYFNATIKKTTLRKINKEKWQAFFQIELGPPLKITAFDITITGPGSGLAPFQNLLKNLPLKKGSNLDIEKYNKIKFDLTNIAAENGFLAAKLTKHAIYIDRSNYTSEIAIYFDTGPQYYFGDVNFNKGFYDSRFLQRFVQFKPGEIYKTAALSQLQQDLTSSIYFSQVSIRPDEQQIENEEVPIQIDLIPSKSQAYNFGLGYGTDTGIRGTASGEWRHLTDTGNYFKAFLQASEVQSSAMARYIIPGNNPLTDQYYLGASLEQQNINNSKGDTKSLNIGRIDQYQFWQRTLALNYQWDHYSINKQPYEKTHLFLPSLTLFNTQVDNVVFPRQGRRITLDVLGTAKPLLSSSTFIQAELDAKTIFSPTDNSRVILRGDVGITAANNIQKVPLSLQFFAGGANSIRGYRYQELGPGRYLFVGSLELQHQVINKWWGTIFFDTGNAVNSLANPKGSSIGRPPGGVNLAQLLKYSGGVGIVFVSPVGPLEVTLAKSISDTSQPLRLQFTMGSNL